MGDTPRDPRAETAGWDARRVGWKEPRVAAEYDARRFRTPLQLRKHANDASLVMRLLARVGDGLMVLDAPTGTGRMLPDLVRAGHRVTGLDLSPAMLSVARATIETGDATDGGLLAAEIERLPFRDNTFDAAVSLRFLFHIRDPEVRFSILREYGRVAKWLVGHERCRASLKHSGRYLRSRVGLSKRYRPAPSRSDLRAELAAAGFELVASPAVSWLFSDKLMFIARRMTRKSSS